MELSERAEAVFALFFDMTGISLTVWRSTSLFRRCSARCSRRCFPLLFNNSGIRDKQLITGA